ncbi:MAG: SDR family oxidoreductase [Rhodanobacteraceae bacterium]
MQRILIIAATSAIAEATARLYAEKGDALYLLARNIEHLQQIAQDLATRGAARVEHAGLDVTDFDQQQARLEAAWKAFETFDIVLIAHGSGEHEYEARTDIDLLRKQFTLNATATLALMAQLAERFKAQRHGTLAVISSVAGDRGRAANLLYGSAKSAIDAYASGQRQRMHKYGVNVLTIKPGWVDTPMTSELPKSRLFVQPERVARGIVHAIERRRSVVYLPWFWRPMMFAMRHIPEPVWKHMKF